MKKEKNKEKNVAETKQEEGNAPEKIDLKAAHHKVIMVMVGLFIAALVLMIVLSDKVEFASTGGM